MLTMTQEAPWPKDLAELVSDLKYRPGWTFLLVDRDRGQGSKGLTFVVYADVQNSLTDDYQPMTVAHYFIVPAASYNRDSWMRWLLDRILDVERHEACEFFRISGERVYAPHHSEGEDPYIIWQIGDAETANKRSTDK